jgi:membrane protein
VSEVVEALRGAHLLRGLASGGLVPGRPAEKITLLDIRVAVRGKAPSHPKPEPVSVDRALAEVEAEAGSRLAATTFRTLCDEERARRLGGGDEPQPASV